ncbi:hypothetical protein LP420_01740 [Massilia sp. B-10]|nr:hypothetical protein LP420_01740 [Massilia sp. B-10]
MAQQRISLVALALPRLSLYRDTGATRLDIALDQAARLAPEGAQASVRFFGRCRRPAARHHWRQRATGHGAKPLSSRPARRRLNCAQSLPTWRTATAPR